MRRLVLTLAVAATLAGCAVERREPPPPARRPADIRAQLLQLLPSTLADRDGWATDFLAAFQVLQLDASISNLCAALAVTEQESSWRADPLVPNLPKIAWGEIEKRAEKLGVPMLLVRGALLLDSPTGKTFSERIDNVKTERELSDIFEDFIGIVPLGIPLLAGPGAIVTTIVDATALPSIGHKIAVSLVVALVALIVYVVLRLSAKADKYLSPTAMTVFNRVMGIIIASIAIEFILTGLAAKFPVLTQAAPL